MSKTLSHIAIAVKNVNEVKSFFEKILEVKGSEIHSVDTQKVDACFIPIGDTNLELLEPQDNNSPISKFLKGREGGLHHLCIESEEFDNDIQKIKNMNVRTLGEPSIGAKGRRIIFFHPKDTYGILLELEERN